LSRGQRHQQQRSEHRSRGVSNSHHRTLSSVRKVTPWGCYSGLADGRSARFAAATLTGCDADVASEQYEGAIAPKTTGREVESDPPVVSRRPRARPRSSNEHDLGEPTTDLRAAPYFPSKTENGGFFLAMPALFWQSTAFERPTLGAPQQGKSRCPCRPGPDSSWGLSGPSPIHSWRGNPWPMLRARPRTRRSCCAISAATRLRSPTW
jgi:hypothetical protein